MEPLRAATLRTAPLPAGLAASLASAMLAANGAEAGALPVAEAESGAGDAWVARALGALDRTPPPPPEEAVAAYAALLERAGPAMQARRAEWLAPLARAAGAGPPSCRRAALGALKAGCAMCKQQKKVVADAMRRLLGSLGQRLKAAEAAEAEALDVADAWGEAVRELGEELTGHGSPSIQPLLNVPRSLLDHASPAVRASAFAHWRSLADAWRGDLAAGNKRRKKRVTLLVKPFVRAGAQVVTCRVESEQHSSVQRAMVESWLHLCALLSDDAKALLGKSDENPQFGHALRLLRSCDAAVQALLLDFVAALLAGDAEEPQAQPCAHARPISLDSVSANELVGEAIAELDAACSGLETAHGDDRLRSSLLRLERALSRCAAGLKPELAPQVERLLARLGNYRAATGSAAGRRAAASSRAGDEEGDRPRKRQRRRKLQVHFGELAGGTPPEPEEEARAQAEGSAAAATQQSRAAVNVGAYQRHLSTHRSAFYVLQPVNRQQHWIDPAADDCGRSSSSNDTDEDESQGTEPMSSLSPSPSAAVAAVAAAGSTSPPRAVAEAVSRSSPGEAAEPRIAEDGGGGAGPSPGAAAPPSSTAADDDTQPLDSTRLDSPETAPHESPAAAAAAAAAAPTAAAPAAALSPTSRSAPAAAALSPTSRSAGHAELTAWLREGERLLRSFRDPGDARAVAVARAAVAALVPQPGVQ